MLEYTDSSIEIPNDWWLKFVPMKIFFGPHFLKQNCTFVKICSLVSKQWEFPSCIIDHHLWQYMSIDISGRQVYKIYLS